MGAFGEMFGAVKDFTADIVTAPYRGAKNEYQAEVAFLSERWRHLSVSSIKEDAVDHIMVQTFSAAACSTVAFTLCALCGHWDPAPAATLGVFAGSAVSRLALDPLGDGPLLPRTAARRAAFKSAAQNPSGAA